MNTNSGDIDFKDILFILNVRKGIVIFMLVLSLIAASVFLSMQVPQYTSNSVILLNVQENNITGYDSVLSNSLLDEPSISSEVDIILSRSLATKVVEKLDLANDPEFAVKASNNFFSKYITKFLAKYFGKYFNKKEDVVVDELYTQNEIDEIEKGIIIDRFLERISLSRKTMSRTIYIGFTSESPQKARLIASTIVDEYLVNQMSEKFEATKTANEWLNKKILSLSTNLRESELAVQIFKEENNLIETRDNITVDNQQLLELNTHLVLAKTDLAQAEARLSSARNSINSSTEVLNSGLIQSLRQQESILFTKKSDLQSRYGGLHPKVVNINAEIKELGKNIKVEISKIKSGLQNEVNIAKARVKSLDNSLSKIQGKIGVSTKAKVRLSELVRERDANRLLYESFLSRSKETAQSKDLDQSYARIISKAEIPTKPSSPNKLLILIISSFLGISFGLVLVFLVEILDNVFKDVKQLEQVTGVPSIGISPLYDKKAKSAIDFIINNKLSYTVESLRSILTSIYFSNSDKPPKTLLITSSVPSEGKTTFSTSLATIFAMTGKRVLIIDCDMKKPSVAYVFSNKDKKASLNSYLAGSVSDEDIINVDSKTGVHFVSSSSNTLNSQELLSSQKMKDFVNKMSIKYDFVIIDSPPVMAVSDALILARIVDTVTYLVKWNKTPRNVVHSAIKKLFAYDIKISGTVLSSVNMAKYSKTSYSENGYYYKNYKDHYSA